MRKIRISSVLGGSFRDELERIVFFNPEQNLITGPLVDLVRRYGVPEIVDDDGRLRFRVSTLGSLQTLYALDVTLPPDRLVGVAMFTRLRRSNIVVLHIAAHEDYTSRGKWSGESVIAQMLTAIRALASRVRGVKNLRVLYPHEIRFKLPNPRELDT
jgi:hypothetical protein